MAALRFISYLAPGLPAELFEVIVGSVGSTLDIPTALTFEESISGPLADEENVFSDGVADVGFVCAPSLGWLRSLDPPAVNLVGAAPIPLDERSEGRPVYFSDVIVGAGERRRSLESLRDARWAFNDPASLSGYHGILTAYSSLGLRAPESLERSGSHRASIAMVASGRADAAAVDSNVLALVLADESPGIEVMDSLGPHPMQPVVARRGLTPALVDDLAGALLALRGLESFGFSGFGPVDHEHYAGI